jgi:crossover junction endodeoxyribonuclease RuvC
VALGIDPGLSRCGYGVVVRRGGELAALEAGTLRTPAGDDLGVRLSTLADSVAALISRHRPEVMVVERVLFRRNARTAMSVGQASGVALVAAARAGIPVVEVSPSEVKLAVTGDGAAGKDRVQDMVARLLRLPTPPGADAADALALACCHLWRAVPVPDADPGDGLTRAVAAALTREAR